MHHLWAPPTEIVLFASASAIGSAIGEIGCHLHAKGLPHEHLRIRETSLHEIWTLDGTGGVPEMGLYPPARTSLITLPLLHHRVAEAFIPEEEEEGTSLILEGEAVDRRWTNGICFAESARPHLLAGMQEILRETRGRLTDDLTAVKMKGGHLTGQTATGNVMQSVSAEIKVLHQGSKVELRQSHWQVQILLISRRKLRRLTQHALRSSKVVVPMRRRADPLCNRTLRLRGTLDGISQRLHI